MANTTTTHIIKAFYTTENEQAFLRSLRKNQTAFTKLTTTTKENGRVLKNVYKKDVQGNIQQVSKSISDAGKKQNDFVKALRRVAIVVPTWLLFRGILLSIVGFMTGTVKSFMDLEVQMGRVATVTRGTTEDIKRMRTTVVDFTANSSRGFEETAKAMYALGSAGLSVVEQLAGFDHIMNLVIGTFGNTEEAAKLVAGMYNVFGESIKGAHTEASKFKNIADLLAYTYSTQQVELSEIATAMTYVASVGRLVNIEMDALVSTIGVLNTGMLKGTKAGTSLMNAFIRLASQSDKLADLQVVFDPSKPLEFEKIMEQLHKRYGSMSMSVQSLKELMDVFGRRGGRAAAQLITDYDKWRETIDDTRENFNGFAEDMREKVEDTLPMAFKKLGNIIKSDLIGSLDASGLTKGINKLNKMSENIKKALKYKPFIENLEGMESVRISKTSVSGGAGASAVQESIKQNKTLWDLILEEEASLNRTLKTKEKTVSFNDELEKLAKSRLKNTLSEKEVEDELLKLMITRGGLKEKESKLTQNVLKQLTAMLNIKQSEAALEGRLTNQQTDKLKNLEKQAKYNLMKAAGIDKTVIAESKLKDMIKAANIEIAKANKADVDLKLRSLNIQRLMNGNYKDLEEAMVHVNGIEGNLLNIKKQALSIEALITKEKKKQKGLSSETIALSKIGQKYGSEVAEQVGAYLTGQTTYEDLMAPTFDKKTKLSQKLVQKHYGGRVEQEEAKSFFSGAGKGISYQEKIDAQESARKEAEVEDKTTKMGRTPYAPVKMTQAILPELLKQMKIGQLRINGQTVIIEGSKLDKGEGISVGDKTIAVTVILDGKEISAHVTKEFVNSLGDEKDPITKKLKKKILGSEDVVF